MANLYEFVWSAYTPVRVMPLLRGGPLAFLSYITQMHTILTLFSQEIGWIGGLVLMSNS